MIIRGIIPFVLVISAVSSLAQPRRVILDKVVAVVGQSSILYSEVKVNADQLIATRREEGYTSDRDPMNEVLESLLEQKLLANQALIDSIEINDSYIASSVKEHLNSMVKQAGGIAELEKEQGMKLFSIRENLRSKYEEQSLASGMRREVTGGVTIVPSEVEKFYKGMKSEDIPMVGDQYTYAQITKFPKSIDEAKRRVKERLLDMRQRIITGEARFAVLAQMYSVDPGSAFRGGEMTPQPSSAFVGPFAEALEGLKVGQVSEIVETEFGFHILELLDKQGDLYHCRHILLRPSYTPEEISEPTKFLDSISKVIKQDSLTFEHAAKLFSDDADSKMNGGVVSNHDLLKRYQAFDAKLAVTKFLKEDFGARGYKSIDDYMALTKLKEGEVSRAFATEDMVGNQLSKVVKLIEIIPAHKANIDQDYLKIEALALEEKMKKVYDEWLRKHIMTMYVYISPEFRSEEFEHKAWLK